MNIGIVNVADNMELAQGVGECINKLNGRAHKAIVLVQLCTIPVVGHI